MNLARSVADHICVRLSVSEYPDEFGSRRSGQVIGIVPIAGDPLLGRFRPDSADWVV